MTMRIGFIAWPALSLGLLLQIGCEARVDNSSTNPVCDEGARRACNCEAGVVGWQTCASGGKSWSSCDCLAPSGAVNPSGSTNSRAPTSARLEDPTQIQVVDTGGRIIANADVYDQSGNLLGTTDRTGWLHLPSSLSGVSVLNVKADGFAPSSVALSGGGGGVLSFSQPLNPVGSETSEDADDEITVTHNGASLTIPAGGLVDGGGEPVSGFVDVQITFASTSQELTALGTFGLTSTNDEILESLGAVVVSAEQGGEELKLAPGVQAQLRIPASVEAQTGPPTSPPLWRQNTTVGKWDEIAGETWALEGTQWVAQIDALATWNCDFGRQVTCVRGQLLGPQGTPLVGVSVNGRMSGTAAGFLPSNTTQTAITGSSGTFCMEVVPEADLDLSVICPGGLTVDLGSTVAPDNAGARCSGPDCTDLGTYDTCCFRDSDCPGGERCVAGECRDSSCGAQQTAGADAPERRVIDLGTSNGTFTFSYDMQTVKDQMRVYYEGQQLLDTGCVSGGTTESLSIAGSDTFIVVEVDPNCEGTTGTAWSFSMTCPQ